jgi:DNA-directed RNA polymerase specialized sigma24 family protein
MGEITRLLDLARSGDAAARDRFFSSIYAELDHLARSRMRRDDRYTLLDAPGLVNEVYLRMSQHERLPGVDRRSFLAYASRVMRSVIIDALALLEPNGAYRGWSFRILPPEECPVDVCADLPEP